MNNKRKETHLHRSPGYCQSEQLALTPRERRQLPVKQREKVVPLLIIIQAWFVIRYFSRF